MMPFTWPININGNDGLLLSSFCIFILHASHRVVSPIQYSNIVSCQNIFILMSFLCVCVRLCTMAKQNGTEVMLEAKAIIKCMQITKTYRGQYNQRDRGCGYCVNNINLKIDKKMFRSVCQSQTGYNLGVRMEMCVCEDFVCDHVKK